MRILFATCQPHLPQMHGGLQSSAHELALALRGEGHDVAMLCALMPTGWMGLRGRVLNKLAGKHKAARDTGLGYSTWRAWFPLESLRWVASRFKPDLVVVLARQPVAMAKAVRQLGLPVLMMLQDVEFADHGGNFAELGDVACVANSGFTAQRYHKAFGVNPIVIPPLIDGHARYATPTTRETVTFINPHPFKGLAVALELARLCPEIPFTFVESWPILPPERQALMQLLAPLPNITFRAATGDMREIYSRCKVLLAPSQWEEAFGRVVTEAQISGIPALASDRGGLPEAVGPGGYIVPADAPPEVWAQVLRTLWTDNQQYYELSRAALAHSARAELQWSHQATQWQRAFETALANNRS